MNQQMFLFFLMLFLALLCALCPPHAGPTQPRAAAKIRTRLHRLLKPRCPHDCPACRLSSTASLGAGPVSLPVRPWREVKSRRGAPKRVNTEGFACPNPKCLYFSITDDQIHALIGDGKHGRAERIQTFRCQACRTTFTSRRNTPLYRLKTPSQQIAMVLSAAFRRTGSIRGLAGLRLPTSHHHHLAHSRWRTCTDLVRTLLLQSSAPASATG